MSKTIAVNEQHDPVAANDLRIDALRSAAQARIDALREELAGTRRRNAELVKEVDRLVFERDAPPNRRAGWSERFASLSARIERTQATPPSNPLARQLARLARVAWWTVTLQLPRRVRMWRRHRAQAGAEPKPIKPSEHFRGLDPQWVEPEKRPEFIRLREIEPPARVAVVLHLFYAELWPEMLAALRNMPVAFDLFVTLTKGVPDAIATEIQAAYPDAHLLMVDNHGRDILPFVQLVRSGVLFHYELVCKLHGKRSSWRDGGDEWRKRLMAGVLKDTATVSQILAAFAQDPDLGIVVADGEVFQGREFWVSNEKRLLQLLPAIGLGASSFEAAFCGGSIFWIRPFLLRPIDFLALDFDDFELEPIPVDGATAHAIERLICIVCHEAGMRIVETNDLGIALPLPEAKTPQVRLIANYLPQFHPVAENNRWWGPGFTEWTNVARARPMYEGHRQPRIPADLGFYDLRLAETRNAQADLARRYGIDGFCYYYYWFDGRRILERPLDEVLRSGEPDFPFMICWANEPWTRNWDGMSNEVLLPQSWSDGWERGFAADVAPILQDSRYIRLNGQPVLAIYRIMQVPEPERAMRCLRAALADAGLPDVALVGGWLHFGDDAEIPERPEALGLDAYFEFPPHRMPRRALTPAPVVSTDKTNIELNNYPASVDAAIDQLAVPTTGFRYHGVMAGWDNTPRLGRNTMVMHGATPATFRRWLRAAVRQARIEARGAETAVFINAWNEWAEGTNLEPDRDFGHGWLEAVASVLGQHDSAHE